MNGTPFPINHRVRALLLTPNKRLLLIKRVREGRKPYYVTPGGGVEPQDASFQAALKRELLEELGAEAEILHEVFSTEHPGMGELSGYWVQHHYYLCRLNKYNLARRTGPEFLDPSKGSYIPEAFPLRSRALSNITLDPPDLKRFLQESLPLLIANL
jgi:8-oxo-dGTP pyrophosphatase MutT (NUDIX family)